MCNDIFTFLKKLYYRINGSKKNVKQNSGQNTILAASFSASAIGRAKSKA